MDLVKYRDHLQDQLAKARGEPFTPAARELDSLKDKIRDQVVAEIVADLRARLQPKPDGAARFKELLDEFSAIRRQSSNANTPW